MHQARVLLVDDHAMVLEGLTRLLSTHCNVIGAAESGEQALEMVSRLKPDIVLLDMSMPGLSGLEIARQFKARVPTVKIVFVTMLTEPVYVSEAFRAGASGYVLKQSASTELVTAIQSVLANRTYLSPLLTTDVRENIELQGTGSDGFTRRLTTRQQEVLRLLSNGYSSKDIAKALNISVKTVEFHKSNIVQKLGVRTTSELTKFAIAHGMTSL